MSKKDKQVEAATVETEPKKTKKSDVLFIALNLVQMAFFIAFTVKGFVEDFADSAYMPAIIVLMLLYVGAFVAVVVVNIRDRKSVKQAGKELKGKVKDTKLAIKVITVAMLIINVVAAALVVLETYSSSDANVFQQAFALGAAAWSVLLAVVQGVKVGKKVKKRVKKAKKAKEKAAKA